MYQYSPEQTRPKNLEGSISVASDGHERTPPAVDALAFRKPSHVLGAVFELLDRSRISYCLVHGYERLPESWGSDIDIVVERSLSTKQLLDLLSEHKQEIGAEILKVSGSFVTLLCKPENGLPTFLLLDFCHDYSVDQHHLCSAEQILQDRRGHLNFWIPAPSVEFECLLARSLLKDKLDEATCAKLSMLFAADRVAAKNIIAERWAEDQAASIVAAASSGNWHGIIGSAADFTKSLKRKLFRTSPGRAGLEILRIAYARLTRFLRPQGISIALLGPDGAGKSSAITALEEALAPLFARNELRGFAPSLRELLKRAPTDARTPHALAPRSPLLSLLRAAYWALYGLAGHGFIYWAKARATLVLYDRHFIDILVDPVRYRYGGPKWALRLIWHIMVKPDLIILLTGPAEVLQARKNELTLAETERQCRDYLALVAPLRTSRIINTDQPFDEVARDVCAVVIAEIQ